MTQATRRDLIKGAASFAALGALPAAAMGPNDKFDLRSSRVRCRSSTRATTSATGRFICAPPGR
jgi:hypothetical protein